MGMKAAVRGCAFLITVEAFLISCWLCNWLHSLLRNWLFRCTAGSILERNIHGCTDGVHCAVRSQDETAEAAQFCTHTCPLDDYRIMCLSPGPYQLRCCDGSVPLEPCIELAHSSHFLRTEWFFP